MPTPSTFEKVQVESCYGLSYSILLLRKVWVHVFPNVDMNKDFKWQVQVVFSIFIFLLNKKKNPLNETRQGVSPPEASQRRILIRGLHWVPIPTHAHGLWVGMSAILLFMGGHMSCYGWAWVGIGHCWWLWSGYGYKFKRKWWALIVMQCQINLSI